MSCTVCVLSEGALANLRKEYLALFLCLCSETPLPAQTGRASTGPATLTFEDLITAAEIDPPPPALQQKMDVLFDTPFVSNSADTARATTAGSSVLHVAEWNMYRTPEDQDATLALADAPAFLEKARRNPKLSSQQFTALQEQARALRQADIVILNEVDDGVDRENYHNVPHEVAAALHMNYAYAVEFLELNRIYMGVKKMDMAGAVAEGQDHFGLDPSRYLGLEGTALLSRYPIQSARIIHLPAAYDWYHDEIRALSDLEKVRRWTAQRVFEERVRRQVRRGGRVALVVQLRVADAPGGMVTVVCPHLEDYCASKGRRRQMDALLSQIRDLKGPVLVGGDLNTLGHNGRPLTIASIFRRWLLNYRFWIREAAYFFLPVPGAGEIVRAANYFKNLYDPTAISLPIVLSNPERGLFTDTRSFRFDDGGKLDFSGDPELSFERHGKTLSDSAQRQWKGFTPTFTFERTYHGLIGELKLDWMFVKRNGGQTAGELTPTAGRTLTLINKAVVPRISPHSPTELEIRLDAWNPVQAVR